MSAPRVSVVIPTAGRPSELAGCLAAVRALDWPDVEVVVVDDTIERRGPGAARNAGAQRATGAVLAFTDDDCRPDPGWLRALVARVAPGVAAGGRTVNALAANPYAAASQHIQDLVYAHYNADPDDARFFASSNLAVRRADFLAVGGFDGSGFRFASEDRDLCDRWRASGRTLRFAPDAVVAHAHDLTLASFARQHLAYGRGAARFHRARARRGSGRLRDDLPFHRDLALYRRTLAIRPRRAAVRTAALLGVWQVANAAGFGLERVAR